VDVEPALVADGEPAEAAHPGEGALDDPAVPAEPLAALDAAPGDARLDPAAVTSTAAAAVVGGLIGVQLVRPLPGSAGLAADGRDGVEQFLEGHAVVDVGPGQQEGERDAAPVGDEVSLRARPAPVRRVRAGGPTPLLAGTAALSSEARLQSIRPAARRRRSSSRWSRSQTPARCHSRSRRQQVTPDPQPISRGSISQGMPDFSTNRMPVSAARFDTLGRPPFGFGGAGGSKGSTTNHNSSDVRSRNIVGTRSGWPL